MLQKFDLDPAGLIMCSSLSKIHCEIVKTEDGRIVELNINNCKYYRSFLDLPIYITSLLNQFQDLRKIRINRCLLVRFSERIKGLPHLEIFEGDWTVLKKFPSFLIKCPKLSIFSLVGDWESPCSGRMPPISFPKVKKGLLSLKEFKIAHYPLKAIPQFIVNSKYLETIEVYYAPKLTISKNLGKRKLKRVVFFGTGHDSIPATLLACPTVEYLNFSKNNIVTIPPAIEQMINLRKIHLEKNKITALPIQIAALQHLETLALDDNFITEIPPEISTMPKLEIISANVNLIKTIPMNWGPNLGILELQGNLITSIPRCFRYSGQKIYLYLSNNLIRHIDSNIWKYCGYLVIGKNPLQYIPAEFFCNENIVLFARRTLYHFEISLNFDRNQEMGYCTYDSPSVLDYFFSASESKYLEKITRSHLVELLMAGFPVTKPEKDKRKWLFWKKNNRILQILQDILPQKRPLDYFFKEEYDEENEEKAEPIIITLPLEFTHDVRKLLFWNADATIYSILQKILPASDPLLTDMGNFLSVECKEDPSLKIFLAP